MASREQKAPAQYNKMAAAVFVALLTIALGVFLLVTYVPAIDLFKGKLDGKNNIAWLIAVVAYLGGVALFNGVLRKEIFSFWFAWVFFFSAFIIILCEYINVLYRGDILGYKNLYPGFILEPAVASALSWIFSRAKASHLKIIIVFTAAAALCCLNSFYGEKIKWYYIAPAIVIVVGAFWLINALTRRRGRWDDGDRAQRNKPVDEWNKTEWKK